jgi:pectate lyase
MWTRWTRRGLVWALSLVCLASPALSAEQAIPAFPGAEGYGAVSTGGRGGRIIKVTNLKTFGPGSFQEACHAKGRRIVVFEVSGVIHGDTTILEPHITIAGQTAPGAGITLDGALRTASGTNEHDIIVRHVRVRPTKAFELGEGGDAITFGSDKRIIFDHVSCSWASDETIDLCGTTDVTVQWSGIEESATKGHPEGAGHNFGLISAYTKKGRISIHHNFFAHHSNRCPMVRVGPADIRNNVVYNFHLAFSGPERDGHGEFNLVGNYYKRGPNIFRGLIVPFYGLGSGKYYFRDNFFDNKGKTIIVDDPWKQIAIARRRDMVPGIRFGGGGAKLAKPAKTPPITTHTSQKAYEAVLKYAGCFPRDGVTQRMIKEIRGGTGSHGSSVPKDLMAGLTPARPPKDTDGDGMPDAWEKARGLDPNDSKDANKAVPKGASEDDRHKAYTYIEYYINDLADALSGGPKVPVRRIAVDTPAKTIEPKPPQLVTGLKPGTYKTAALRTGVKCYTDRGYTLAGFPDALKGSVLIAVANSDKSRKLGAGAEFTISKPATVYIGYAFRVQSVPEWIEKQGFKKTDMNLWVKQKGWGVLKHVVYQKKFEAGEIELGSNQAKGFKGGDATCNYLVVVRPE